MCTRHGAQIPRTGQDLHAHGAHGAGSYDSTNKTGMRVPFTLRQTWVQVCTPRAPHAFLVFSHFDSEITCLFYLSRSLEATREASCGRALQTGEQETDVSGRQPEPPGEPDSCSEAAEGKGTPETELGRGKAAAEAQRENTFECQLLPWWRSDQGGQRGKWGEENTVSG